MICKIDKGEESRFIQCDHCDLWTHYECAKLTQSQVDRIVNYFCDKCTTPKRMNVWHRDERTAEQKREKAFYYDVRDIIGHREDDDGGRRFLVAWDKVGKSKTFPRPSWEPECNLDSAIDILQHYCRTNSLPLSEIQGLVGANRDTEDPRVQNWVTMATILSRFRKLQVSSKLETLEATEWTGFEGVDKIYFLKHGPHCFVLLFIASRNLAFIADGTNSYRDNSQMAKEIKARLGVRLIFLPFNQQRKADHCGSSAVVIAIEMLRLHKNGPTYKQLVCTKTARDRQARVHKHKSKSIVNRLELTQQWLECDFCGKKFQQKNRRALNMHIRNNHSS